MGAMASKPVIFDADLALTFEPPNFSNAEPSVKIFYGRRKFINLDGAIAPKQHFCAHLVMNNLLF